jgi:hypothetical protein
MKQKPNWIMMVRTCAVTKVVKDIDLNITDSPVIHLKGSGEVAGMGVSAAR